MTILPEDHLEWTPPRCSHGNIILGCPESDCSAQNAYLDQQNIAIDAWYEWQRSEARRIVREALGLPSEATARCVECGGIIHWQECPTGGWWIHENHPADDHDGKS
jgi:hypothetical protein